MGEMTSPPRARPELDEDSLRGYAVEELIDLSHDLYGTLESRPTAAADPAVHDCGSE